MVKCGCRVSVRDYPEQQSGGVVGSHQAVDGLEKPPQRLLKLRLLLPLVQPRGGRRKLMENATERNRRGQRGRKHEGGHQKT